MYGEKATMAFSPERICAIQALLPWHIGNRSGGCMKWWRVRLKFKLALLSQASGNDFVIPAHTVALYTRSALLYPIACLSKFSFAPSFCCYYYRTFSLSVSPVSGRDGGSPRGASTQALQVQSPGTLYSVTSRPSALLVRDFPRPDLFLWVFCFIKLTVTWNSGMSSM